MAKYKFTAKSATGQLVTETVNADSETVFFSQMKERGLYLINYKTVGEGSRTVSIGGGGKLSLKQTAIFCRQIAAMLGAGVTLVKAIDILYQQSFDRKVKLSVQKLYESVQKGDLLSEGLRKQGDVYPDYMVSMIESGESSGTIDKVMAKLADKFESDLKLKNKITSAMVYPLVLALLCIGVVIILLVFVLPTFTSMFDSMVDLPVPTQILLGLSDSLAKNWFVYLGVVVAISVGSKIFVSTEQGRLIWDETKLKIPVFGPVTQRVVAVRFCRTFSTLFSSGMPMLHVLEIVSRVVNNAVVGNALSIVREDVRKGVTLSQAVSRVTVFPPMIHSMILIGEESGTLDATLENTADYFDDELENAIQKMVTVIEPPLIIFMGVVVGFVVISIMLPMVSMYENI